MATPTAGAPVRQEEEQSSPMDRMQELATQIGMTLSGVKLGTALRLDELDRLSKRCQRIADEISSKTIDTPELRTAVFNTNNVLTQILKGCERWSTVTGKAKIMAFYDSVQTQVGIWDADLNSCMLDFLNSVMLELSDHTKRSEPRLVAEVDTIFSRRMEPWEHYMRILLDRLEPVMNDGGWQTFLDRGEERLNSNELTEEQKVDLFTGLKDILSESRTHPPSVILGEELTVQQDCIKFNTHSRIYGGKLNGLPVAVKRLAKEFDEGKEALKFEYEGAIWRMLPKHPNLLPFYGIHISDDREIGLVTMWVEGGAVMPYIAKHPQCDRRSIIRGAASGLAALHRHGLVHGDIRPCNILIEEVVAAQGRQPQPRICDFGLSACASTVKEVLYAKSSSNQPMTVNRYFAPERCDPEGASSFPAQESDVFCFGRTIYEVATRRKPFWEETNALAVSPKVLRDEVPTFMQDEVAALGGLSDQVWELLLKMWARSPTERPQMSSIITQLEVIL